MLTTAQKHKLLKEFNQEREQKFEDYQQQKEMKKTQQKEETKMNFNFDEGPEYQKLYKHLGNQNKNKDLRVQVKDKLEERPENQLGPNMWLTLNPQYRLEDDTFKTTFKDTFKGEREYCLESQLIKCILEEEMSNHSMQNSYSNLKQTLSRVIQVQVVLSKK